MERSLSRRSPTALPSPGCLCPIVMATAPTLCWALPIPRGIAGRIRTSARQRDAWHELGIYPDEFAPADGSMGLVGQRERVSDANDFRRPRRLAEAIPHLHGRHGDLYFTRAADPALVDAARLVHRDSGRVMTVR